MFVFESFLVFFLGLALGSFSTAISYRVPRDISWWGASRSQCTDCKTVLRLRDLAPVFSWLASQGRCRHCDAHVHYRYPLIELTCGALAFSAYLIVGLSLPLAFILLALPFLIALFLIDLEKMILPNQLVLILFIIGVARVVSIFPMTLWSGYAFSCVIYGGTAWLLAAGAQYFLKKEALGFGDVKFFAVAGLWLGLPLLPYFMIGSGGLAVFFALFWSWRYGSKSFPFGPALIVSFYILLLFGGSIL